MQKRRFVRDDRENYMAQTRDTALHDGACAQLLKFPSEMACCSVRACGCRHGSWAFARRHFNLLTSSKTPGGESQWHSPLPFEWAKHCHWNCACSRVAGASLVARYASFSSVFCKRLPRIVGRPRAAAAQKLSLLCCSVAWPAVPRRAARVLSWPARRSAMRRGAYYQRSRPRRLRRRPPRRRRNRAGGAPCGIKFRAPHAIDAMLIT